MMFSGDDQEESPQRDASGEARLLTRQPREEGSSSDERIADSSLSSHAEHERNRRPRSRILKRLFHGLLLLVLLLAAALLATALWLRHTMRASLPQVDGTIHVEGLSAPVTVTRDAHGVPSIHAATFDDLLFAQGYVTAQDRLWQMDALRRHAAGELAEILGPALVKHDTLQRYLQLRATADRAIATLPPDELHQLAMYAEGVNAFIAQNRDRLPMEFHLLHYTPAPWTPRDSLLISEVMWQDLTTSFPEKLDREALAPHLPSALLTDLYPTGSWRDRPPTQPPANLTQPREIEQIPLDRTQAQNHAPQMRPQNSAQELLAITRALSPCPSCRAGSNNWAVAGSRSKSGAPLLSNDMHLSLSAPDIWYEASLHAAATEGAGAPLDVAGFTLPGVPFVIVGRNAHVAWSFTNLGADVQDVWVEHLRGSGANTEFERTDGSWARVEHHTEHIRVRGGRDVTLDVLTTDHTVGNSTLETPVISPLYPKEKRALALGWTLYDTGALTSPFLSVNLAADGASLAASLGALSGPSLNLIYADDQGHIGYHAIGRIPVRGPAVQHERLAAPPLLEQPEPESEEDDEDDPQAMLTLRHTTAQVMHVAYLPQQRRGHRTPRSRVPQTESPPISAAEQPAPPQTPPHDYTIGSPISGVPVDSLDLLQQWSGYIPYDQLPAVVDPQDGYLATANARVTPDDYPYYVTLDWADAYRVERINHLLEDSSALTPQAMLGIQMDQHSEFDLTLAERLAYALDHASDSVLSQDRKRLTQAANLLRDWNGNVTANSSAAAIVTAAHAELWPMLLAPQIQRHDHVSRAEAVQLSNLYAWQERTTALEDLLLHASSRWLPPGVRSWNDLLTQAVERGLKNRNAPSDLTRWSYADVHTIDIEHPVFAGHTLPDHLLGVRTGSGAQASGGDLTTIDTSGRAFGPSERFTADLAAPDATLANITTGESGNPRSAWYLDQFPAWLRGTSFALPLEHAEAAHTLTLVPR